MAHGLPNSLFKDGYTMTLLDYPGYQPVDDLKTIGTQTATKARAENTFLGDEVGSLHRRRSLHSDSFTSVA